MDSDSKENDINDLDELEKFHVVLDQHENPRSLSLIRRWTVVLVISFGALCVTCSASIASFTEGPLQEEFHVSHIVAVLSVSLYVLGLGIGPLLIGPLSEVYGRNLVYRVSYALVFAFTFPVAFAPNIAVHLIFRFITGFCGAAFLSVAGGSVADLFPDEVVANPMAVYTLSPVIGPVLGPIMSGLINQHLYWRWTYRIQLIWVFFQLCALCLLVPETYAPALLKSKIRRLRQSTGDTRYFSPLVQEQFSLLQAIVQSFYKSFQLLFLDITVLLLDIWQASSKTISNPTLIIRRTALIIGILFITFQAFPLIFKDGHGFSIQSTGLAFLGTGIGMVLALCSQPLWNRVFTNQSSKYNGKPPPEIRLIMGQVGGVFIPIGLFWLAFTSPSHIHWILPIVGTIPFGAGIYFVFTSVMTYLVTAYRPLAASVMASNTALRLAFAAIFPLFSQQVYGGRLGKVGATALFAGLTTVMASFPFIFYRVGAKLRKRSRFAVS